MRTHNFKSLIVYIILLIINVFFLWLVTLSATFFASAIENSNYSSLSDFFKRLTFTTICGLVCGVINILICFGFKSVLKYSNSFLIKGFLLTMAVLLFYFLIIYAIIYFIYFQK